MMRLIITGGSGFIGTNLIDYYKDLNVDVVNFDIVRPKNVLHEECWRYVDIMSFEILKKEVLNFGPTHVIHLAARTDLKGSRIEDYDSNVQGVRNLVEVCKSIQSLEKIIFTSSMLVCDVGFIPKSPIEYCPATIYGQSKVMGEKIVKNSGLNCDWTIVRPTSIWGPWFSAPYLGFFNMVQSGTYFHIGKLGCIKTYGYVGNVVYQLDKILNATTRDESFKVLYLGDYSAISIEKFANEIGLQLGKKIYRLPYIIFRLLAITGDLLGKLDINFPMTTFRLKNMTTDNRMNLDKTEVIVGELPYSLKQGVASTLEWLNRLKRTV